VACSLALAGEAAQAGAAQAESAPAPVRGTVAAVDQRELRPPADAKMRAKLDPYRFERTAFDWRMTPHKQTQWGRVWLVQFPTPQPSRYEVNNTVYCEYYRAQTPDENPRPAVVVLHILNGDFKIARLICNQLMVRGVHSLMVKMAYYDERRPAVAEEKEGDLDFFRDGVLQSVGDVRRARDWLASRPEIDGQRVGLTGVSLGAMVGSLTAGVDGNFKRTAFVLGGGDLAAVLLTESDETSDFRESMRERGMTREKVVDRVRVIDPLEFAARVPTGGIMMINMKDDEIVPRSSTMALWTALGKPPIRWYEGGHYAPLPVIIGALQRVGEHFTPQRWPATAGLLPKQAGSGPRRGQGP